MNYQGGYQSGQLGQTVNLLTHVFVGSNPAPPTPRGSSSVGRASAFQAEGREFEPRLPLKKVPKGQCSSGVERFLGKEEVMSSNLITGSNLDY